MAEVKPGIYLEVKKGVIGTGHTAKSAEYRNFWMTLGQEGSAVTILLLDEDFRPTGIRDSANEKEFTSGRFNYIPQGDKKYQALLKKLEKSAPTPQPTAPRPAQKEKPAAPKASGAWWESESKPLSSEDLFSTRARDGSKKKPPQESGGNWWEAAAKISTDKKEDPPKAKKKSNTAVPLKKNWWDT